MATQKNVKNLIKITVAAVIVIGVGVGAVIWNSQKSTATGNTSNSSGLTVVKTYTRKACDSTPVVVADAKGFFKKHGLKIEYTPNLTDSGQILTSILTGTNDFAEAHPNTIGNWVAAGSKIISLSTVGAEPATTDTSRANERHMRYFINPSSGVKSFADLKNYKSGSPITVYGTAPNCETFVTETIFQKYGIPKSRIKFVHYSTDTEALQSVKQGSLDIADVHPPFFSLGANTGLTAIGDSTDAGLGETTGLTLLYASQSWVDKNPATAKKLVEAITDASAYADDHIKEAADLTAKATGQPTLGSHFYSHKANIKNAEVQPWIDNLIADGFIKKGQLSVGQLITHKYDNYTADETLPKN